MLTTLLEEWAREALFKYLEFNYGVLDVDCLEGTELFARLKIERGP